jgi:hypothetical protein
MASGRPTRARAQVRASRNRELNVWAYLRGDLLVVTDAIEAVTELNPATASSSSSADRHGFRS